MFKTNSLNRDEGITDTISKSRKNKMGKIGMVHNQGNTFLSEN